MGEGGGRVGAGPFPSQPGAVTQLGVGDVAMGVGGGFGSQSWGAWPLNAAWKRCWGLGSGPPGSRPARDVSCFCTGLTGVKGSVVGSWGLGAQSSRCVPASSLLLLSDGLE